MNYLAHFYLAQNDEGLVVGNLLADFLPGKKYLNLHEDYQRGVLLHRKIDSFTDSHGEVEKTKARLRPKYGKYSPVISDVFYDYILGSNWADYSGVPLKDFTQNVYQTLSAHQHAFPDQAQIMLGYMKKNDWLFHYSTYFGIEKALQGLSRRASFKTNMHESLDDLKNDGDLIEKEFRSFFDELKEFVSFEKDRI